MRRMMPYFPVALHDVGELEVGHVARWRAVLRAEVELTHPGRVVVPEGVGWKRQHALAVPGLLVDARTVLQDLPARLINSISQ